MEALKTLESEQDRQDLLAELVAEHGENWSEQYGSGSFGCHELLDRTALMADSVERYILSHPACLQNEEWFSLAHQAATALHELYQRIGAEHLADTELSFSK
jgi:hypothetical protein